MALPQMQTYTRSGTDRLEKPFEKPVVVPVADDPDPARHAWADARFATDIMAEHGVFFALLMPPEVAQQERIEALRFAQTFEELHKRVDAAGPPDRGDLKRFTDEIVEAIKPFIEYKATLGDAQRNGSLRSLVWASVLRPHPTRGRAVDSTTRPAGRGRVRVRPAGGLRLLGQHHG
jgi:hypothetical protein